MRYLMNIQKLALVLVICGLATLGSAYGQRRYDFKKQGFSMKLQMENTGSFGHVAYGPTHSPTPNPPSPDSLGLEYRIGDKIEHIYGGGLWIGGKLDTSTGPVPRPPLRLVSVCYEGWAGPYYEFFPGTDPRDGFWEVSTRDTIPPAGWYDYWGSSLPFAPISDQDLYTTYTDSAVRVSGHVPMKLKVIQASYAWEDPYADAILIFEYRIMNLGRKSIDSAYIGYFFEGDVGPINVPSYWTNNYTDYIPNARCAFIHNPQNDGSTPAGAALLATSRPLDSLRYTFQWFPGNGTPPDDAGKYNLLSSGLIDPNQFPELVDTRFVFSFGPFTIRPSNETSQGDTLLIAVAIVSGYSARIDPRIVLQANAARALDIYLNQGIRLPATPPSPPLRVNVGFRRVELNWKWQPGDDALYGRRDPELNWDSTNQRTRLFASRIVPLPNSPPPGYDPSRGGRNFESYRVWRSENPNMTDGSFVLLAQYDAREDDNDTLKFEYETGLKYTFVDSNLVRGKTYIYSVTSSSIPNVVYQQIQDEDSTYFVPVNVEPLVSSKLTNSVRVDLPFAVSAELGKVSVVPNPYRTDVDYTLENGGYEGLSGDWDENQRKIKFINLPEVCTIRVFSLSGDLITTIQHDGRNGSGFPSGDQDMFLVSESNRALASGIYLFAVESQYGTQTGKFVIIR